MNIYPKYLHRHDNYMNTFISLLFFINNTFPVLNLIAIDIDNYWLFDLVFVNFA